MTIRVSMICSKQSNGTYYAVCPEIKGCFTQGDTYEEAFANLKELVETTIAEEYTDDDIDEISQYKTKIFTEFDVAVS